jgi:hypothetical protein
VKKDQVLDLLVERLRHHTIRKVTLPTGAKTKDVTVYALEDQLRRARHVVTAGLTASSRSDGYSTVTPGNGSPGVGSGFGGGKVMAIRDEHGEIDWVPTSSTEAAAITPTITPDPVAGLAREMLAALAEAEHGLEAVARINDRFERLQNTAKVPDPPMCWLAQVRYRLPYDVAWDPYKTTDFEGVLADPFDEPRKVSSFVYWYTRRTRQLPSKDDMLTYLRGATVRIRA